MYIIASGVAGWPQAMPRQIWNMPGPFTCPASRNFLASSRWPVSNTSSSGSTPASRIASAIVCRWRGRVDEHAVAHVQAAHVEAADIRAQLLDMAHAFVRPPHRAGGAGLGGVVGVVLEARARAGGQVDQDVGAAGTDALDHLAIERAVHARLGGLGVSHMDMDDRRAGLGGVDAGVRDLFRRHRHRRVFPRRVGRPGHRARNDHLALHGRHTPCERQGPAMEPQLRGRPQAREFGGPVAGQPQPKFPAACLALCAALSQLKSRSWNESELFQGRFRPAAPPPAAGVRGRVSDRGGASEGEGRR